MCSSDLEIGYLVEIPYLYPDLTVFENLEIVRSLRLIKDKGVVGMIMDKMKISQFANRKDRHLSLGNLQRLGLAKALLHHPQLLILDEPANGLDPAGMKLLPASYIILGLTFVVGWWATLQWWRRADHH